jgi:hypothetical protein
MEASEDENTTTIENFSGVLGAMFAHLARLAQLLFGS